ncbi:MAG TPA: PBP1A family penicillin-binding protein [Longimicrobiaceae bacterium]|nr:PBP1A family penicillin-binding protein [Longimicrobiaceae bacterium]
MARSRRRRSPARAGRGRILLRRVLLGVVAALAAVSLVGGAALIVLWPRCTGSECPSVAALRDHTPAQASRVYDRHGRLVAHLAPERRIVVPLERIPARVSHAFLAVEDKRFYRHHGVDYRRVAGALARDLQSLSFDQGFSTITMQLARNVFPEHLTRAKTLRRKLWEVVLARQIERAFSKDEILEMYLNQIYLGQGLHGVEAAAQGYFGKPAARLTPAEAALLAALPRAPSYYDPRRNPAAAVERRNLVLGLMARAGVISDTEAATARGEPLRLAPPAEARGRAPYFVAAVRRELRERFGADADRAGLRVYTTLDTALQASAERELVRQIRAVEAGRFGRFRGPSCAGARPAEAPNCLQGLFVALDVRTGEVLALVGGRDFALSQFDRVTQARRQAGSAFKPIVYATALEQGVPISTPLLGPGATDSLGSYRPRDHVADTANVDLRDALRLSSNRATVVLGERVGAARVVETAKDLGLSTPLRPYPSIFLGAAEVVPLELVAAYAAFANGGSLVRPRLIRRVEDAQGRTVWEGRASRRYALSPGVAFLTTSLMRDVVDRGTGSAARTAGLPYAVPAAGKTGTTNSASDVWFVGATPDVAAGVWFGFDQPRAVLGGDASGSLLAAPVWGRVMAGYYRAHAPPAPWAAPGDLATVRIDRVTGKLATPACPPEDVVDEWFLAGTEPLESCPLHADAEGGWLGRTMRGIGDLFGGGEAGRPRERPKPRKRTPPDEPR